MTQLIGLTAPSDADVQYIISKQHLFAHLCRRLLIPPKIQPYLTRPPTQNLVLFLFPAIPLTVIYATPMSMSTRILPPFLAVVGLFVLFAAGQTDHPVRLWSTTYNSQNMTKDIR